MRLRRLAAELRALRRDAELTRDAAAQQTELNSATLWRIETARARPQRRTLLALMDLYEVVDERRRTELIDLARSPAPPADWHSATDGRPLDGYETLVHFETEACRVRLFESRFIPDPLQTEPYARAVLAGTHPQLGPDETDRLLAMRSRRQAPRAAGPPAEVHVVIDESALHRRIGGDRVHRDQLRELLRAAQLPRITLQVLPYEAGAHVGLHGPFMILDFPDPADAELVCVDTVTGPSFLEGPTELADYLARFEGLRAHALEPGRSRSLLTELAGPAAPGQD